MTEYNGYKDKGRNNGRDIILFEISVMLNELLACTRVLGVLLGLKTMTSKREKNKKNKKFSSVFNFPSSQPSGSMENIAGSVRLAFEHRPNVFRSIWSLPYSYGQMGADCRSGCNSPLNIPHSLQISVHMTHINC